MKIVVIDWLDSSSRDDWHDRGLGLEPLRITSVGIVIEENKSYVTICRSMAEEVQDGALAIPRFAIIKIKTLRK